MRSAELITAAALLVGPAGFKSADQGPAMHTNTLQGQPGHEAYLRDEDRRRVIPLLVGEVELPELDFNAVPSKIDPKRAPIDSRFKPNQSGAQRPWPRLARDFRHLQV